MWQKKYIFCVISNQYRLQYNGVCRCAEIHLCGDIARPNDEGPNHDVTFSLNYCEASPEYDV